MDEYNHSVIATIDNPQFIVLNIIAMKSSEKTALVRILVDLIKADRIIDTGEMLFYDEMRRKYNFTQANEIAAMSISFADAVSILNDADISTRTTILSDCENATVSDGFCAHSEALLLISLMQTLGTNNSECANVISIPKQSFSVDDSTVLYVESKFDEDINRQIVENYRHIYKEFLFSGFQFVYIPNILHHYEETDRKLFKQMLSFLAPSYSTGGIDNIIDGLLSMTTENFCKDILCNRLSIENLRSVNPSLLIKIGNNYVGGVEYSNFLSLEIEYDFLKFTTAFVDKFSSMLSSDTLTVPIGKEANNQYLYYGFYKQLLDIFLIRKNIRSRIVIDPYHEEILLPDIDQKLNGLTRRDKAMYVLFLILMKDNGFSFKCPMKSVQIPKYNKKISIFQKQYEMVYGFMGGDRNKVPDVGSAEIRRPIFSRIKKSLMSISEMLYNVNDYLITKNSYGIFNVNIEPSAIYVKDWNSKVLKPLQESDIWNKVVACTYIL